MLWHWQMPYGRIAAYSIWPPVSWPKVWSQQNVPRVAGFTDVGHFSNHLRDDHSDDFPHIYARFFGNLWTHISVLNPRICCGENLQDTLLWISGFLQFSPIYCSYPVSYTIRSTNTINCTSRSLHPAGCGLIHGISIIDGKGLMYIEENQWYSIIYTINSIPAHKL